MAFIHKTLVISLDNVLRDESGELIRKNGDIVKLSYNGGNDVIVLSDVYSGKWLDSHGIPFDFNCTAKHITMDTESIVMAILGRQHYHIWQAMHNAGVMAFLYPQLATELLPGE